MISIIIPTLNEEENLSSTIKHTLSVSSNPENLQLVVVDSGSQDDTLESIEGLPVQVYSKAEFALKKYLSLNFGASRAEGNLLIFLDADTLLPKHFDLLILDKLENPEVVGGAFEFSFINPDWKLWLLSMGNRVRYRIGEIFYGDQAVWVKKEVFDQINGFPQEPLMETAYFCKKLKNYGKLSLIKKPIKTSPRRFLNYGFFTVVWFDFNMFIRFNLGLSVSAYAKKYWSKNLTSE